VGASLSQVSTSFSMALIGVGHLVGLAVGIAMLIGMLISWGILVPLVHMARRWAPNWAR
jgi:uncharacterized oligopeptide transporter (OPT) family protein